MGTAPWRRWQSSHFFCFTAECTDFIPPSVQPLAEVQEAIVQKLYGEAVQKAVDDYIAKLRKAHKFELFLARIGS